MSSNPKSKIQNPKSFEWQTEVEEGWGTVPDLPPAPPKSRPRPRFFLVVLLILLAVGAVIYWRANRRAEEVAAAVEADVIATDALLRQAAERGDAELFKSFLSGRSPQWTTAQGALFDEGLLFDRAPFGLHVEWSAAPAADSVTVTLSPDLTTAEVQAAESYAINVGNGLTETVTLQRTALYRRGQQRWLFSPPLSDFWGEWVTYQGLALTVVYSARDEATALRLAQDLDKLLSGQCMGPADLGCPDRWRVTLRLATGAGALLATADPLSQLTSQPEIELPTPTLVGLPVDEAGYQALLRGYAGHLLTVAVADLVDWVCCDDHPLLFQALMERLLGQMGLRPSLLTPDDYEELVTDPPLLDQVSTLWLRPKPESLTGEQRRLLLAAVEFILTKGETASLVTLLRSLPEPDAFWPWLRQWFPGGQTAGSHLSQEQLEREWLRFLDANSRSALSRLPQPGQELQLLCRTENRDTAGLYRYDLASNTWTAELASRAFFTLFPSPDGRGVILEEAVAGERAADGWRQVIRWHNGEATTLLVERPSYGLNTYWGWPYKPANRLVFFESLEGAGLPLFHYLNLNDCRPEGCTTIPIAGFPLWSPDDSQTLLWAWTGEGEQMSVKRADGSGARVLADVGQGYWPFWLDNQFYGYVALPFDETFPGGILPSQEVRLASIVDDSPQTVLWAEDLRLTLPEAERPASLSIWMASVNPATRRELFVMVFDASSSTNNDAFLFTVRPAAGTTWAEVLAQARSGRSDVDVNLLWRSNEGYAGLGFSRDGRWLVALNNDLSGWPDESYDLNLFDLVTGQSRRYAAQMSYAQDGWLDWSADGQWLVWASGRYLHLLYPSTGYQRLLVHDYDECTAAVWTD